MADTKEAIRRLTYQYVVEGADKVASAQAAIASSAQQTERASLSLEKSFNNMERRYVATVRAQQDYQRVQEKVNAAVAQNPALQARGNVILENAAQQYEAASRGLNTYGKTLEQTNQQGRLARHEMINLSRQFQDVGVSLASGQSPFMVLVQQGAQIADVFATSTGTIGGFFKQVGAGAARFAASTGGIVTGVAAIGASIGYVATSYATGQRDIERSLSGIGRASGVTRDQINQIGQTSSSAFGLSASEAREAATAFAATGKIYQDNVGAATSIINDFARGGGDATEMTKQLAAAMQDPAKGALDLNKAYGFLDATMLDNIRTLQAQGRLQEAQAALMKGLAPAIQEQAKHVGGLTLAWNAATNAVSNYVNRKGKEIQQQFEQVTGVTAGGFSQEEQLQRATEQLSEVEKRIARISQQPIKLGLAEAEAESSRLAGVILDLENAIAAVNSKAKENALGIAATLAADAILPITLEIQKLQQQLSQLQQYRAQTGGPVTGAEQVGAIRLAELQQQEAATVRVAQATQQIAALYPGMSIETAKQLFTLQSQLVVAQARTPAEAMVVQELTTQNQLLAQGKTLEEAMALAAAQRAIAQEQINAHARETLFNLQNQYAVVGSITGAERMAAQEAATYASLKREGVSSSLAAAVAEQERANAEAAATAQVRQQISALKDQEKMIYARINGTEAATAGEIAYRKALEATGDTEVAAAAKAATLGVERAKVEEKVTAVVMANSEERRIEAEKAAEASIAAGEREADARIAQEERVADAVVQARNREIEAENRAAEARAKARREYEIWNAKMAFVPHLAWDSSKPDGGLFQSKQGGYSQFNPAGYVSEHPSPLLHSLVAQMQLGQRKFVGTGFELGTGNYPLTPQGYEDLIINKALGSGGLTGAINEVFGELGRTRTPFGQEQAGIISRLTNLLPKEDQAAQIKRIIAQVQQQPVSLAREELIKQLNDQLEGLTQSVDSLNGALSPYYSQDPRTTKLGFRAGTKGMADWLVPGASNKTALDVILGKGATAPGGITGSQITPYTEEQLRYRREHGITTHGMASGGSFVVGGGYSATDNKMARFPVASGEQVVVNRRPQDQRPIVVHNDNRIIVTGAVDQDTLSKLKVSRYQQTQRMRSAISAA